MTPVKSGHLAAVGHDGNHLTVEFKDGSRYLYRDIPAKTHLAMMAAPSVGEYFATHIRKRHKGEKVS